jgi:molecular chaperone DnaJ
MSATNRDYYEVLGLSRDADDAAIKKAFRRAARELHPDVSDHPEAEVRFREVTEAYEVLSDSEMRTLYDRFGHRGLRSGGFQPTTFDMGGLNDLFSAFFGGDIFGGRARANAARGADVAAEIEVELTEAATGATVTVPFRVAVTCATCHGDGVEPETTPTTCARCGGSGRLQQVTRSVFGEFVRAQACPARATCTCSCMFGRTRVSCERATTSSLRST